MTILAWFDTTLFTRIVLTLGHFVWQGAAIALIVVMLSLVLRNSTARLRYMFFLGSLLLMTACPVVTFWFVRPVESGPALTQTGGPTLADESDTLGFISDETAAAATPADRIEEFEPAMSEAPPDDSVKNGGARVSSRWQWAVPYLTVVYLLGVISLLGRLLLGLQGGRHLRRRSQLIDEPELLSGIARSARMLGMQFTPTVLYCKQVAVPTVVGVFRPAILLPLSLTTGLSPDQVEAVLTHELAHVRRYDHLVNILQRVIESLLFFHPAVWWVSHRIRVEREICCDDVVVTLGAAPLRYAACLLDIAERGQSHRPSLQLENAAALHAAQGGSQLSHRVRRLVSGSSSETLRLSRGGHILALVCLAIMVSGAALLQGQTGRKVSDRETEEQKEEGLINADVEAILRPFIERGANSTSPSKPQPANTAGAAIGAKTTKNAYIPAADSKGRNVILDLASDEMLPMPKERTARAFARLGKGDLAYERKAIICLRGAKAMMWNEDRFVPLARFKQKENTTVVPLPNVLPCRMLVTTAEKLQFDVTIQAVTSNGGMLLKYHATATANSKARDADHKHLQGFWKVLSVMENGRKKPNANVQLIVHPDRFQIIEDGKQEVSGSYAIDSSRNPKTIEFHSENGPLPMMWAIYEFPRKGSMRLSYRDSALDGLKERPTSFNFTPGDDSLTVLELQLEPKGGSATPKHSEHDAEGQTKTSVSPNKAQPAGKAGVGDSAQAIKTVYIPAVNSESENVVLDLASGDMLPMSEEKPSAAFTLLGKGDLAYEQGGIICLRGATAMMWNKDRYVPLAPFKEKENATAYTLPNASCRLLITTAEKEHFDVAIQSVISIGGILLKYRVVDKTPTKPTATEADHKRLRASWKVLSVKKNGDALPQIDGKYVFHSDRFQIFDKGEEAVSGSYTIDTSRNPKTIDLHSVGQPTFPTIRGIYDFPSAGRLRICYGDKQSWRPTSFDSIQDGGNVAVLELRLETADAPETRKRSERPAFTPTKPDEGSNGSTKKVHLRNAEGGPGAKVDDFLGEKFILDLGSGQTLAFPADVLKAAGHSGQFLTNQKRGDLLYAGHSLFCLRGATAMQWDGNRFIPMEQGDFAHSSKGIQNIARYELTKFPCRLLITTAEKKEFEVNVLSVANDGGIDLEYRKVTGKSDSPETSSVVLRHLSAKGNIQRWRIEPVKGLRILQGTVGIKANGDGSKTSIVGHGIGGRRLTHSRPFELRLETRIEGHALYLTTSLGDSHRNTTTAIETTLDIPKGSRMQIVPWSARGDWSEDPHLTSDEYANLWEARFVRDDKVVKSHVFVARLIGEDETDSTIRFQPRLPDANAMLAANPTAPATRLLAETEKKM